MAALFVKLLLALVAAGTLAATTYIATHPEILDSTLSTSTPNQSTLNNLEEKEAAARRELEASGQVTLRISESELVERAVSYLISPAFQGTVRISSPDVKLVNGQAILSGTVESSKAVRVQAVTTPKVVSGKVILDVETVTVAGGVVNDLDRDVLAKALASAFEGAHADLPIRVEAVEVDGGYLTLKGRAVK